MVSIIIGSFFTAIVVFGLYVLFKSLATHIDRVVTRSENTLQRRQELTRDEVKKLREQLAAKVQAQEDELKIGGTSE